jgi:hypothetical protein
MLETIASCVLAFAVGSGLGRAMVWKPSEARLLAYRPEGCLTEVLRGMRRDSIIAFVSFNAMLLARFL